MKSPLRYSIEFSTIEPREDARWVCPVCLDENHITHGDTPSEAIGKIICSHCDSQFWQFNPLEPVGVGPKRGRGMYYGPDPKMDFRRTPGAVYHIRFVIKPGEFGGTEWPFRYYWVCPRCQEERSHAIMSQAASVKFEFPPNLWCSYCKATYQKEDADQEGDFLHTKRTWLPTHAIREYEPTRFLNRLEILNV